MTGGPLAGELKKLFARRRTYIGFAAFLLVEIALLLLLRLERVQNSFSRLLEQAGYGAEYYLSGLTLGLLIVMWTVFLLGALYLALVGGDLVSKEVEDGTLRMMLCRPVSRARILLNKLVAGIVYTAALTVFIAVTALAAGLFQAGKGGLFFYAPLEGVFAIYDWEEGLVRYAAMLPLLTLSLTSVMCLALFFSCLKMKPAAATIITLTFFFVDSIMRNIPYFESIKHWFVTAKMTTWVHIFEYNIPWEQMLEDYMWLFGMNATLILAGLVVFQFRDFKS